MSDVQYSVVYTGYGNDEPVMKRIILHGYDFTAAEDQLAYVLAHQDRHGVHTDACLDYRPVTYGPWYGVEQ